MIDANSSRPPVARSAPYGPARPDLCRLRALRLCDSSPRALRCLLSRPLAYRAARDLAYRVHTALWTFPAGLSKCAPSARAARRPRVRSRRAFRPRARLRTHTGSARAALWTFPAGLAQCAPSVRAAGRPRACRFFRP